MPERSDSIQIFCDQAERVSAKIQTFVTVREALGAVVDACSAKAACVLPASGCEAGLSRPAEALCGSKTGKTIAAPNLSGEACRWLDAQCRQAGITTVFDGLRNHLAGIDVAVTRARYGIAETGTVVIDSSDEDLRLATMISEIHMVLLRAADIRRGAGDLSAELKAMMAEDGNYTAMITGASRTADIERVLALGVHGPLELHILLIGGE